MSEVTSELCCEKHKGVNENMDRTERRLNAHSEEIDDIKQAVLKLTIMVDSLGRKSWFDKILIIAVFIIAVCLLFVMLGPELSTKVLKEVVK